ncbi:MAG: RtcB family protein [Phycisphaerae bacterium]|nr:RtcB family protein [Phycisphaerae bacterium]
MSGRVAYERWGTEIDGASIEQMDAACSLPVARAGALMPDAHVGYGLPIGGVLATEGAIIPYAVGVDIACRMRLTVMDVPPEALEGPERARLVRAIETQTRFGVGAQFDTPREHAVMDEDWSVSPVTRACKDRAWRQLGTSGSGNHFVEWGVLTVAEPGAARPESTERTVEGGSGWRWDLQPGRYLALLSHSGSRGVGAQVCEHYSRLAMRLRPFLEGERRRLAWLDMDSTEGREYFEAMNLMGRYAAANHETIHRAIVADVGAGVLGYVENHHNFAWKERHTVGGVERELVVHRKGATPAGRGVMGVIPGSMTAPGYVVVGLGSGASLSSASHGAGRRMSRTRARASLSWNEVRLRLAEAGVELLSAGLDEAPGVYKDIAAVMEAQRDLVLPVARFDPRIVKMAPDGERAED